MKYYLLDQGADKIQDHLWPYLVANEPKVKELTKEEYETNRGFGQAGQGDTSAKDVSEPVGAYTAQEPGTSFSRENTKKEILAELEGRGIEITSRLKQKNKAQLLEML